MAINFGKSKKIAKSKSEDRRATVQYHPGSDKFFATLNDGRVLAIVEDYNKAKLYYSKPINDHHYNWHETTNGRNKPMSNKTSIVVKTYWATVKPKQKIRGTIVEKTFVIKYT